MREIERSPMDHDRLQRRAFLGTLMGLTIPYVLSNYNFFMNSPPPRNLVVSYCFLSRKMNFARVALSRSYLETSDLHLRRRHCVVSWILVSAV
jgi:hypothetical protein